ncbi:hypothetical protein [Actinomadura sp. 6K520]|uniref:hypothetical protein n=1 Tax=Actinomadura sp. 6K520 TaxID=2530364 RepID=UPI00104E78B1|nr:hypothetical protein [Actinomadura sp. 6K520]TDE35457.1 hypothetical protein E1289_07640 [Actinomadura sp. 6K520]
MAQHVYVKGRLSHSDLSAADVRAKFAQKFSTFSASPSGADFEIKLQDVEITGFSGVSTEVEFTVEVTPVTGRSHPNAVASTVMLIDGTETFLAGAFSALTCERWKYVPFFTRKPKLEICEIKSSGQHNPLLHRDNDPPKWSIGAKAAYFIVFILVCITAGLVLWQTNVRQPSGVLVQNLLAILLSLPLAALGALLPIYINQREWKKQTPWKYSKVSP